MTDLRAAETPSHVSILPETAAALTALGIFGTVSTTEPPERMAWIVFVLQELPDTPERFPHGRWGTIQHIERQVCEAAEAAAKVVSND